MYPPKGRCWKDGQDKLLATLCEWAPYELKVIDDASIREDICGGEVSNDIPAIMLACDLDTARKIATERYNTTPWPKYFFYLRVKEAFNLKHILTRTKEKWYPHSGNTMKLAQM